MKNLFKFVYVLAFLISGLSFGQKANTKGTALFMNSLEKTVNLLKAGQISESDLKENFEKSLMEQGVKIVDAKNFSTESFSDDYKRFEEQITLVNNFDTETDYLNYLSELNTTILNSKLVEEEKQVLVNSIEFEKQFVSLMDKLNNQYPNETERRGWWKSWGKCLAGTLGGAITGGVVGCGGIGAIGGLVGSVVPGAGTAVGAAAGCIGGGIAGAIGGGLTGAATLCP
ncbi:hypothetical protein [uncultured Chryseobacterium sp.]|uniref:hypothetical protein n=1 Tax=uncultured Chryseobacterium sp. TaxID=259322 RepID=UPI0025D22319|nr:hypothetical protein [uncultured Chryseobacterium sp.]